MTSQWYEFSESDAAKLYLELRKDAEFLGGIYSMRAKAFEAGYLGHTKPCSGYRATELERKTIDHYYRFGQIMPDAFREDVSDEDTIYPDDE